MAGSTPNRGVCAFCGLREQNKETGRLLKTSDDKITAHLNCTIFSPKVITTVSSNENFGGFDINSVKKEIKRGKKAKCKLKSCRKRGATIGCDIEDCKKTYHYMCAKNDGAKIINNEEKEKYIILCKHHRTDKQDEAGDSRRSETSSDSSTSSSTDDSDTLGTPRARKKRKKKGNEGKTPRKKTKAKGADHNGDKQGDAHYSSDSTDPGPSSRHSDASNKEERQKQEKQRDPEDTTPREKTNARKSLFAMVTENENQDADEVPLPVQGTSHDTSCDRSSSEGELSESLLSSQPVLLHPVSLRDLKKKQRKKRASNVEASSQEDISSQDQRMLFQLWSLSSLSQDSSLNIASQHNEGLNDGDTAAEQNAIPVSTDGTSTDDSIKKKKPVDNNLAEGPECSARVENISTSQSENCYNETNPCSTISPNAQGISVVQSRNSPDVKSIRMTQPTSSSKGDLQSNKQCVGGSHHEGVARPVGPPAVSLEQSMGTGVEDTQSAESSLNILGMNSSPLVEDISAEQSLDFSRANNRSKEQPKCFPEGNCTSPQKALLNLDIKSIEVPQVMQAPCTSQSADSFPPAAQCSNTAVAQSTRSPRTKDTTAAQSSCFSNIRNTTAAQHANSSQVHRPLVGECPSSPSGPRAPATSDLVTPENDSHPSNSVPSGGSEVSAVLCDTENRNGPFAGTDTSTKVAILQEYKRMRDQMFKGDLKEDDAKRFWNKIHTQDHRLLLENIENSVKSVSNKILSGEAENQDYEEAFRYLWGSRCIESAVLQEMQAIEGEIQALDETKERLQKKYKDWSELLGTGN
eukprot:XP_002935796.2 PREDICTED: uncharacterized protein LOC733724 [Xenopus tropicalis]